MPRKYPLEPVAKMRSLRVDDAARTLAAAVVNEERVASARRTREGERRTHEVAVKAEQQSEQARLERGGTTARDLMQGAAWSIAKEAVQKRLTEQVATAARAETAAREVTVASRGTVLRAKTEAQVVERHREGWTRDADRAQATAEELESDDLILARRSQKTDAPRSTSIGREPITFRRRKG